MKYRVAIYDLDYEIEAKEHWRRHPSGHCALRQDGGGPNEPTLLIGSADARPDGRRRS
jgi:hypothetical protein